MEQSKVTFKDYNQKQMVLFPESLEDYVPENHQARIVNHIIDRLNITKLMDEYKGGGTSSYHPRMMLKVLIYAYLNNITTSRKIEAALKENIFFMWLSGKNFPDHRTINLFRGKRLKNHINEIFTQVVLMLADMGLVSLKDQFTDGTKIEANANRYTFVWKGAVEKNKAKLETKLKGLIEEIEQTITEENKNSKELEEKDFDIEEVEKRLEELNEKLSKKDKDKKAKKLQTKTRKAQREDIPRMKRYNRQMKKFEGRNSYSKTDKDATFMRLKEDHMKNSQLKPAYNLQYSTENHFVTNFTLHRRPGDTATLKPHLEVFNKRYGAYPEREIADAGFGSEENYEYLKNRNIENYVKYNWFHKEQKKKFKHDISRWENYHYNEKEDYFVCPMGQRMYPVRRGERVSELGYKSKIIYYQAQNCSGCPIRGVCHEQKGNRQISVNHNLLKHRGEARENLLSEEGVRLRGKRCAEVEQAFGQLKNNMKFKRFLLRGIEKVTIEIGLMALAHNLLKLGNKYHKGALSLNIDVIFSFLLKQNLIEITFIKIFKFSYQLN
jgi:transposase